MAVALVSALVIAVAILLARQDAVPPLAEQRPKAPSPTETMTGAAATEGGAVADVMRTTADVDSGAGIRVVDQLSGSPVAQATLTMVTTVPVGDTLLAAPSIHANADGRITVPKMPTDGTVAIVRAPGHVPAALRNPPDGAIVELLPAASLHVAVVDPLGRPVSGAGVVLTTDGTTTDLFGVKPLPEGIGHPLAARPRWVGTSDGSGQHSFDELPSGRFFLNVVHPLWVPRDAGANSKVVLAVGVQSITLLVEEMYGVVFACPEGRTSGANVDFRASWSSVSVTPQVIGRIPLAREWLAARHPGAFVYVHRPLRPELGQVTVACQARLEDGTRWHGDAALRPLIELDDVVFLERDDRATRTIVIDIEDSEGAHFDGVALAVSGESGSFQVASGERIAIPHGEYHVTPQILSRALYAALKDWRIRVDEASPERFVATSQEPMVEVIVLPTLPSDVVRGPLEVYFDNEDGEGPAVVNWVPGRGPIRRVLAAKQISLRVRSVAYRDLDVPLRDVAHGKPNEIRIQLEDK